MSLTRRGRITVLLLILLLFLGVPVAGGYLYLRSIGVYGSSEPGKKVVVEVDKGADAGAVGEVLEGKGVIRSSFGFRIAVRLDGGFEDVEAGRYELPQNLTARDALKELVSAVPKEEETATITFPEGSWLIDFASTVEDNTEISGQAFFKLVAEGKVRSKLLPEGVTTLEGLLFPSTYELGRNETARSLAERLVSEMEEQASEAGLENADTGLTAYESLIVASMVEAEAALDEERPKIARVILNRLEQDIALGIDATVIYALGEHKTSLTESDLAIDSPYNTRLVKGLPPTPIGAPGAASLEATANPAEGEWLYYVLSDCEGHHAFSESYDEFLQNKAAYQALDCS